MRIRNIIGAGLIAGTTFIGTATTAIADPPDCTAGDLANVMSGVNAATASYLFTHPDVNAFFTGLEGAPRDTIRAQVKQYMDANPQTKAELTAIRQPLVDIKNRCGAGGDPALPAN